MHVINGEAEMTGSGCVRQEGYSLPGQLNLSLEFQPGDTKVS